jgi:hypothetical protein
MVSPSVVLTIVLSFFLMTVLAPASTAFSHSDPPFGEEWRKEAMDLAQQFGMFGPLTFEDGLLRGAFVEARVTDGPGNIASFSMVRKGMSTEVFASVEVEGAIGIGLWGLAPSGLPALLFEGPDVSVRIHNNPTRALIYRSLGQQLEISFIAAPGVVFVLQGDSILVAGSGFTGLIAVYGPGSMEVQPGIVRISLSAGSAAAFRAHPGESEGAVGPWAQQAVLESLARQRLGAELFLVALEGGIMEDAVIYSDISVTTSLDDSGRLQVFISRESQQILSFSGTILVINMHREVLNITDPDRLSVELDDSPVERTDVVDELPSTDSPSAKYYVASGSNGLFLMVYIPQLSLRVLTIGELVEQLIRELTPTAIAYILLGVAVTALASAAVFRRGREGW